uniref:Gamma-aminobutyric acid type A receptor subunit theta n=1 Tax=Moschus moschiferus TaxID=68415 RepID=A0A8C6CRV6_MOSMO
MSIRGMLRAAVLLLLIRTWLAEGSDFSSTPKFHLELSSTMPEVVLNLFDCKNCANEATVHKILDRVLSNYDGRLRPNFGGKTRPGTGAEIQQDYTITMFFHQTWKDPRLAYHETNLNLTLDYRLLEKLWVPDCYFLNSKEAFVHDTTVENRVFQLYPDGTVRYGIRLTTTTACSMNLEKFPLDKQTCKLEVESYAYTVDDILLYWEGSGNAIQGTEKLHIPQFSFLGKTISTNKVFFHTGSYVRLILRFLVKRQVTGYLVQIYWPSVLTTVVSWISFWMNYEFSTARVTVGLTSMLILNSINSLLWGIFPQFSYIKAIDIYMVVCFFFVFLSLVEYVYINYLFYNRRGSRLSQRQLTRALTVMKRYRYREANMLQRVDETDSPPSSPRWAGLASPESLGSLASLTKEAPLASSESLSLLSSLSDGASLAATENLSDLPSTSEQVVHHNGIRVNGIDVDNSVVPTKIRNRAEAHGYAKTRDPEEDPEESSDSDESEDDGPSRRHLLVHGQRHVQEATYELQEICNTLRDIRSLPDDVRGESSYLDLEEQLKRKGDSTRSLYSDDSVAFDGDKESNSESDDSSPPSPGCSFSKGFSSDLFHPDYIPKVDRCSRLLFPLAFVVFNIVYWVYHIY